MMHIETFITDIPSEAQEIFQGLFSEGQKIFGEHLYHPYAILVKDEKGNVQGGVLGELKPDHCHIKILWISENHRGIGLGKKLLDKIEELAREKSLKRVQLHTYDFFNKDFYLKNDFKIIAVIEKWAYDSDCSFLRKEL